MAGAFQSNAFQGDAFQSDATFTGGSGQAQCEIHQPNPRQYGQAQADIKQTNNQFGQAQARIVGRPSLCGQAQCIVNQVLRTGQAQCKILVATNEYENIAFSHNPLGYFPLDETSGDTFANSIGTGNATRTAGTINYSVNHALANATGNTGISYSTGSVSKIDWANSDIPTATGSAVTITGYINLASNATHQMMFGWFAYEIYAPLGGTGLGFNTGGGDVYGFNATSIRNKWVHIAVVYYDNQSYVTANKIYINGVNQTLTQQSGSPTLRDISSPLYFSGWGVDNSLWASGTAHDALGIYDRELTSAEILDQYNAGLPRAYAQAQAYIIPSAINASGQAQADILTQGFGSGQSQCDIKAVNNGFGQANSDIKAINYGFGQSQCDVKIVGYGSGQSQADILAANNGFGQGNADILAVVSQFGQAQCDILTQGYGSGQAQAALVTVGYGSGQANSDIKSVGNGSGQATASILGAIQQFAQAQADILTQNYGWGQAQCDIKAVGYGFGQSQADILVTAYGSGQAQSDIKSTNNGFGQSQADILATNNGFGQAQSDIKTIQSQCGQAQCEIAEVSECTPILTDTFSRTFTGNPGTPDLGPGYSVDGGYDFISGDGDNLILTRSADDYDYFLLVSDIALGDGEIQIDFNFPVINDSQTYVDIARSYNSFSGFVELRVFDVSSHSDPTGTEVFIEWLSGITAHSNLVYIPRLSTNTWYTAKLKISGTTIQGKVWERDSVEPDWQLSLTDVSGNALLEGDEVDIYGDVGEGGSNGDTALYDNYQICSATATSAISRVGQAQAYIIHLIGCGQAQAFIRKSAGRGQAQADIKATNRGSGQAKADIKAVGSKFGQANALILKWAGYGQAQADIKTQGYGSGQAQTLLNKAYQAGQARCDVKAVISKFGQAQCMIGGVRVFGQAQCQVIKTRGTVFGQAQAFLSALKHIQFGQAQAYIYNIPTGQAQADIKKVVLKSAQAQTFIFNPVVPGAYAQAQCTILKPAGYGQAMCFILPMGWGQAQCTVIKPGGITYGQAQCKIITFTMRSGQAQCYVNKIRKYGQSAAWIKKTGSVAYGLSQAMILGQSGSAQAQAKIVLNNLKGFGQAQVFIDQHARSGQAQTLIDGGDKYTVKFNGMILPGYAQSESYDSVMNTYKDDAAYLDLKFEEYTGLQNKTISLRFKAWTNNSFADSKESTKLAATIVRSKRQGFAPLYIKALDRHYLALTRKLETENDITATHTYDYSVEFECKPWLITDATNTITGTGLIDTDQVGRELINGGWSPVRLTVTGTDVTVSGYTAQGDFAGFISVSGVVTNLQIDSEAYTATVAGVNKNELMKNLDYALYVGPGKTYFEITGADDCTISWEDRHYL